MDFTKNPYDPASYDFTLTDDYVQIIHEAGSETFYRFGAKIEHWRKKYLTIVPADFHKWAVRFYLFLLYISLHICV